MELEESLSFFNDGEDDDTWFPLQFYYRNEMLQAATRFEQKMRLPWLAEQEPLRPDEIIPDDIEKWDVNVFVSLETFFPGVFSTSQRQSILVYGSVFRIPSGFSLFRTCLMLLFKSHHCLFSQDMIC